MSIKTPFTATLGLIALCLLPTLSPARVLEETVQTYDLSANGSLSLGNVNGNVNIRAWDGDQVRVTYRILGSSEQALDRVTVRIDDGSDHLRIETKHHCGGNRKNRATVEYDIDLPASTQLRDISLVNGSLLIDGVTAAVEVETVNGAIEARGLAGHAQLSTVNGRVDASFQRLDGDQQVAIETVNGRIKVHLPADSDVHIRSETVHGSLRNDFGLQINKGFVGKSLDDQLGSGSASLRLDTVNGAINIQRQAD